MNFLSLDLCRELQAAGIVNESGFVWDVSFVSDTPLFTDELKPTDVPAYVAEIAFLGPSETAIENARKWFGNIYRDIIGYDVDPSAVGRQGLNMLDTKESVEDFLTRTRCSSGGGEPPSKTARTRGK